MVCRGGQQPLVVGIAAHNSVKDDDVRRLDLGRGGCDVDEPPRHPVGDT